MNRNPILVCLVAFLALLPASLGDGIFFQPVYYDEDIHEPTQKAAIIHDGAVEQMIIQAGYQSDAAEFAWVIPVPAYPQTEEAESRLFQELHYLTEPVYKRAPFHGFRGTETVSAEAALKGDVTVHEQKQAGVYDVSILSSANPSALIDWLQEHGYHVPDEAKEVIGDYVDKSWYFVATRISLAPFDEALLRSLQRIDPAITSVQAAVSLLTGQLTEAVKAEAAYGDLGTIIRTELDFGPAEEGTIIDERFYGAVPPPRVIGKDAYTRIYEDYHGYLPEHMRTEIEQEITRTLQEERQIPSRWQCQNKEYNSNLDYTLCAVWEFSKEDKDYLILKDAKCSRHCSLLAEEKAPYTIEDMAKAAAESILLGDGDVASYFHESAEKREWSENRLDVEERLRRNIERFLESNAQRKVTALQEELARKQIERLNGLFGTSFLMIDSFISFMADSLEDELDRGVLPLSSSLVIKGALSLEDYLELKQNHDGDHNEITVRNAMQKVAESSLLWKERVVQQQLREATIQPLSIRFATPDIIYPLKISSVNKGASEILLYVFAKHKITARHFEQFKTEYAKWIETDDIKTDEYFTFIRAKESSPPLIPPYWHPYAYYYLNELLDDRYYLTKLRAEMLPQEMVEDVMLAPAEDDREFRLVVYDDYYILSWIGFFVMLGIIWGVLFCLLLLPRWVANRFITRYQPQSALYVSIWRAIWYAAVFPALLLISQLFTGRENAIGKVLDVLSPFFEFLYKLMNLIGIPKLINGIVIFIIAVFLFFGILHVIASTIVLVARKMKKQ
ncbi:TPA: DUF2330 domain-containing protein [Candidatus Woesearchaeota archaeon]|nr:DUF2330 domain-containing protein [Candidatus Woesearchaeota archaeon]